MYNELNNTRAACDQLSREKVKLAKNSSSNIFVLCFMFLWVFLKFHRTRHDVMIHLHTKKKRIWRKYSRPIFTHKILKQLFLPSLSELRRSVHNTSVKSMISVTASTQLLMRRYWVAKKLDYAGAKFLMLPKKIRCKVIYICFKYKYLKNVKNCKLRMKIR